LVSISGLFTISFFLIVQKEKEIQSDRLSQQYQTFAFVPIHNYGKLKQRQTGAVAA
jgi:hypothetical protein